MNKFEEQAAILLNGSYQMVTHPHGWRGTKFSWENGQAKGYGESTGQSAFEAGWYARSMQVSNYVLHWWDGEHWTGHKYSIWPTDAPVPPPPPTGSPPGDLGGGVMRLSKAMADLKQKEDDYRTGHPIAYWSRKAAAATFMIVFVILAMLMSYFLTQGTGPGGEPCYAGNVQINC